LDQWKIHRDRTRCDKPGCPLPTAQEFYAVLELPGCVRRDLCAACFRQLEARGKPPIHWKARRKEGRRAPVLDLESLRALFDRLADVEDETARGLRYFIALLLLRKRALRMVDPVDEEQERADLVVADPRDKDKPPVALFAPEPDPERLAGLKDELIAALDTQDDEDGAVES